MKKFSDISKYVLDEELAKVENIAIALEMPFCSKESKGEATRELINWIRALRADPDFDVMKKIKKS